MINYLQSILRCSIRKIFSCIMRKDDERLKELTYIYYTKNIIPELPVLMKFEL